MAYLLDANIFIQPHRTYYHAGIVPGYWDWLSDQLSQERSLSIQNVLDELKEGKDDVTKWAEERSDKFLPLGSEDSLMNALAAVSNWVENEKKYKQAAKNNFLNKADYFLCAYALAGGHTIVTQEGADPNNRKKVLIPIVCIQFDIPYKGLYEYMKLEKARFVMEIT